MIRKISENLWIGIFVLMKSAADAFSNEASEYGQGLLLQGMKGANLRENQFADVGLLVRLRPRNRPDNSKKHRRHPTPAHNHTRHIGKFRHRQIHRHGTKPDSAIKPETFDPPPESA